MVVTFDSDSEQRPQKKHLSSGSAARIEGSKNRNRGKSLNSKSFGKIDSNMIGDGRRQSKDEAINFLMKYADEKHEKHGKREKEKDVERDRKRESRREVDYDFDFDKEENDEQQQKQHQCNENENENEDLEKRKDNLQLSKNKRSVSLRNRKYGRVAENPDEDMLMEDEYGVSKDKEWGEAPKVKSVWKVREEDMMAYKRSKNYYPIKDDEPAETSPYTKGLYITASLLAAGVTVAFVKNRFFS